MFCAQFYRYCIIASLKAYEKKTTAFMLLIESNDF